jgi:hypothetical protein
MPQGPSIVRTPTDGGPVSSAVNPWRIRASVAGGTAYVWVARSTSVLSATKALSAVDVPTHFVGWISQPNVLRVRSFCGAKSNAPPGRAGRENHVVQVRHQVVSLVTEEIDRVTHNRGNHGVDNCRNGSTSKQ